MHLLELPPDALAHVVAFVPDIVTLSLTCKALREAVESLATQITWLAYQPQASCRPLLYQALTWRAWAGLQPQQLVSAALQSLSQSQARARRGSGSDGIDESACLQAALAAARHGDCAAALLAAAPPHAQHLLAPCLAQGGHSQLLEQLLTVAPPPRALPLFSLGHDARAPLPAWAAPDLPHHDVLQTAMLCGARTGQADALRVLLQHASAAPCLFGEGDAGSSSGGSSGSSSSSCLDGTVAAACMELCAAGAHIECCALLSEQLPCAWRSQYVLVAAASSGSVEVTGFVLQRLPAQYQQQQLPAALVAAGQAGHAEVLQQVLALPVVSQRPLQLAATKAGEQGWGAATLQPLLAALLAQCREDATGLLVPAMAAALEHGHSQAGDLIWGALVQGHSQPGHFADLLSRLASAGQLERVHWVLQAVPPVLVRVGNEPALAAAEHGRERVAAALQYAAAGVVASQLVGHSRGGSGGGGSGERDPRLRGAAMRGAAVAAARRGDAAATRQLLAQVQLAPPSSAAGFAAAVAAVAAAAAAGDEALTALLLAACQPNVAVQVAEVAWCSRLAVHAGPAIDRVLQASRIRAAKLARVLARSLSTPHARARAAPLLRWHVCRRAAPSPALLLLLLMQLGVAPAGMGAPFSYLGATIAPAIGAAMDPLAGAVAQLLRQLAGVECTLQSHHHQQPQQQQRQQHGEGVVEAGGGFDGVVLPPGAQARAMAITSSGEAPPPFEAVLSSGQPDAILALLQFLGRWQEQLGIVVPQAEAAQAQAQPPTLPPSM